MAPILSLIIPYHNHKHYLPRLLNSILIQDFKNLEVIIIDDCSNENCSDIISAYINKGINIKYFLNTVRLFARESRCVGIAAAQGDIIGFADADDTLWGTESLGKNVSLLEQNDADILHFRSVLTDTQGKFVSYAPLAEPFAPSLEGSDIFYNFATHDIYGSCCMWNKLYTAQLCRKTADYLLRCRKLKFFDDLYFNSIYFFNAKKYTSSTEIGYGYNLSYDKDRSKSLKRATTAYKILEDMIAYLLKNNCENFIIDKYTTSIVELITTLSGRASFDLQKNNFGIISDKKIKILLEDIEPDILIKTLLVGNGSNAAKIVNTLKSLKLLANS